MKQRHQNLANGKTVQVTTRISSELFDRMTAAIRVQSVSQALFVSQAIEAAIPDPYANVLDDYNELGRRHRARIAADGGPSIER